MKVEEKIRGILAECKVEGNVVYLPDRQLDRADYDAVNKVLNALGGKWNRKEKGHVFEYEPESAFEEVVLTGEYSSKKKDFQFFETPKELAEKLCDMAEITSDCRVVEPSVGKGRIADEILRRNPKELKCYELNRDLERILSDKEYAVEFVDFLEVPNDNIQADRIVMNPPFSKQQDIEHVYKAYEALNPDGILVAVMSVSHTYRKNQKSENFNDFLMMTGAEVEMLPEGTFKESGTMIHSCIVKIRKAA